ncbi:hypothetical protein [Arthrobacter sp. ok362]|uniref:hypothetical protein n=1 Tax=Arthrobacter sp. ok362 TaxID=1761745 RepID=UPI00087E4B9F|nr:hypothetical protein [Arthrobacter sp. ok362]SDK80755.1 hypothetical protein SAMN04487913_103244 [Arthrobacter sp. ok362]
MSDTIGYVVIEYNQASGLPSIAVEAPYLFDDADEAAEKAAALQAETNKIGRRERYAIGTIYIEED